MKLTTPVNIAPLPVRIGLDEKIMVLGSCFADSVGARLAAGGFDVCINPFGTLYNPASIAAAVKRLESGRAFTGDDCVEMGAGAGRICSFFHHTSFARKSAAEFLDNANARLQEAHEFWISCSKVIITFGTAMVWRHLPEDIVVGNCLKRPAAEFNHSMLSVSETEELTGQIIAAASGKELIFTVSPIRHLSQGAHSNTLSKATLHLGLENALEGREKACYFPAFEILNDELRDYRFYADDLVHPSKLAVDFVWDKFLEAAVPSELYQKIRENEKTSLWETHHNILK